LKPEQIETEIERRDRAEDKTKGKGYLKPREYEALYEQCNEIAKMLSKLVSCLVNTFNLLKAFITAEKLAFAFYQSLD
jgi:hypothetical protein